jgi:hypothetical protein
MCGRQRSVQNIDRGYRNHSAHWRTTLANRQLDSPSLTGIADITIEQAIIEQVRACSVNGMQCLSVAARMRAGRKATITEVARRSNRRMDISVCCRHLFCCSTK